MCESRKHELGDDSLNQSVTVRQRSSTHNSALTSFNPLTQPSTPQAAHKTRPSVCGIILGRAYSFVIRFHLNATPFTRLHFCKRANRKCLGAMQSAINTKSEAAASFSFKLNCECFFFSPPLPLRLLRIHSIKSESAEFPLRFIHSIHRFRFVRHESNYGKYDWNQLIDDNRCRN